MLSSKSTQNKTAVKFDKPTCTIHNLGMERKLLIANQIKQFCCTYDYDYHHYYQNVAQTKLFHFFLFWGNTFSANRFLHHGDGKSRGQGCYRSEDGVLWCTGELNRIKTCELIASQWSSNQPTKRPWSSPFFPKDESQAHEKHTSWGLLNIWDLQEIRFKFCSILSAPGIGCSIFLGL